MSVSKSVVPISSFGLIIVVGLILLLIPFITYWVYKKRSKLKVTSLPVWTGVAVFIVASLILEPILHAIVLHPAANGSIALANDHPYIYALYGAFAAGIFEETGRYIGFRYLKKRVSGFQTAIAYGIGHGGTEMIMLGAMGMLNMFMMGAAINAHNTAVLSKLPSATIHSIVDNAGTTVANSLVERVGAFIIQIGLSIVVWAAVNYVGKKWLYPLAIVFHAIIDMPSGMFQAGLINSEGIIIGLLVVCIVLLALFDYFVIIKKMVPTR